MQHLVTHQTLQAATPVRTAADGGKPLHDHYVLQVCRCLCVCVWGGVCVCGRLLLLLRASPVLTLEVGHVSKRPREVSRCYRCWSVCIYHYKGLSIYLVHIFVARVYICVGRT